MHRLSRFVLAGLLFGTALVGPAAAAAEPDTAPAVASAAHPRLLFGAEDIPALRQKATSGEPALAWAKLKEKVDSYTNRLHPNYVDPGLVNDPTPLNNPDWTIYDGFFGQSQMGTYLTDLGFAYVLSGDERYGRHAVELLGELAGNWPTIDHELGKGDLTKGVGLAFDWTYDLMTVEERARIVDSLVDHLRMTNPAARDGVFNRFSVFSCLDREFEFDGTAFNWTGVCGGGNGLALLAIEDEPGVPDLTPWMNVVRDRVVPYFQRGFGSQGDGAEGVVYAGYGLHNALPLAFAWKRLRGEDWVAGTGLTELPAWLAFEQLPGRGTRFVPRNDSSESAPNLHEVIPMLFEVRPDGLTGWLYDNTMGPQGDAVFTAEPVYVADPLTANHTCTDLTQDPNRLFFCWRAAEVFTLLYHQGAADLPRTEPSTVTDRSRLYPDYGLVGMRTGWAGGSDEVVATFEAKHDHPDGHWQEDLGNFSLYGYGGRFAVDSDYGHNYACDATVFPLLQGCKKGVTSTVDSGRAIGHNVPIIADLGTEGRDTQGKANVYAKRDTIEAYLDSPDRTLVRSDLRNAYDGNRDGQAGDVRYAERDLLFSRTQGQPVILAVADRLNLDGAAHDYQWQMHTDGGNLTTTDGPGAFTVRAPSGGTLTAAVADTRSARRIDLKPWDQATYSPFGQPLTHTVVVSADSQERRTSLEHLAVTALTAPGEPAAAVSALEAEGGNLVSVVWADGEALVASVAYGSGGVSSERLSTDGELAQVTVLPPGAAGPAETVLAEGTSLVVDGRSYVEVTGGPATVVTSGDSIRAEGPAGATYRVLAPQQIQAVTVNGAPVVSCRDGEHLTFPCQLPTTLALTAPTTAFSTDPLLLTAALTSDEAPLGGRPVTFTVGDLTKTEVTDDGGQAAVSLPLDLDPGRYPVAVTYAGGSGYAPSSATSWLDVVPDVTTLVYTGQTQGRGETVQVSAMLTEDGDVPLPGRTVSFTLQRTTVTATTDAAGRAETVMDALDHGQSQTVSVHFPGQTRYAEASTTAAVTWGGPIA